MNLCVYNGNQKHRRKASEWRSCMKALFIGGTGTISSAVTARLAEEGHELYLLNRGNNASRIPEGVHSICADINDEANVEQKLRGMQFDVVADFIAFVPEQLERDYRLFQGRTKQFIYISSASAYQKPLSHYVVDEGTPLCNPYWEYSRNKIKCEELLMRLYREEGFPVTIVRPSHTYCERSVPSGIHGRKGSYQILKRMLEGKQIIVHGDGSALWTMTHAQDFAEGFTGLMGNIHAIGESVQITGDETVTWNQIYQAAADTLGVEWKPFYVSSKFLAACSPADWDLEGALLGDKANSVVFDNTKLKRLVPGFCARIRVDQGIRQAVEYVMSHTQCQTEDQEFEDWCERVIAAQEEALAQVRDSLLCK